MAANDVLNQDTVEIDRAADVMGKILAAISTGGTRGLQRILDLAEDLCGNPLVLGDASYRILLSARGATTETFARLDADIAQSLSQGYLSGNAIEVFEDSDRLKNLLASPHPVFVSPEFFLARGHGGMSFGVIDSAVRIDGVFVAVITLVGLNKGFSERDFKIVELLSRAVATILRNTEGFQKGEGNAYEAFLANILDGSLKDKTAIELRLQFLGRALRQNLRVYCVRASSEPGETPVNAVGQAEVRKYFSHCLSLRYQNGIVVLASSDEGDPQPREGFEAFLAKNSLCAGVSDSFADLIQMPERYGQCVRAIDLGLRYDWGCVIHAYDNLVLFDAIDRCAGEMDLMGLVHPAIRAILEEDAQTRDELLSTIYLYLFSDKNAKFTRSALHIHQSTLYYRINKLRETYAVDFHDGDDMLRLMLSFAVLEYYTALPGEVVGNWMPRAKNLLDGREQA